MSKFTKGHVPWTKGVGHSEDTKKKISLSLKGRKLSEEHKRKIKEGSKGSINFGKFKKGQISAKRGKTKYTDASIMSASLKRIGKKLNCRQRECPYCDKVSTSQAIGHHILWTHLGKIHPSKGKKMSEEFKQKDREWHLGKPVWNKGLPKERQPRFDKINSEESKLKMSSSMKRKWKETDREEKERRMKILWSSKKKISRPNKSEIKLYDIIKSLSLPYKYVGDGSFLIGWKNPDFVNINKEKKVIELFGDYWHKGENPKNRINLFKKYGYDCLVIWENELKEKETLKNKLMLFEGVSK